MTSRLAHMKMNNAVSQAMSACLRKNEFRTSASDATKTAIPQRSALHLEIPRQTGRCQLPWTDNLAPKMGGTFDMTKTSPLSDHHIHVPIARASSVQQSHKQILRGVTH